MKPQISFLIPGSMIDTFLEAFYGLKYQTEWSWKFKLEHGSKAILNSRAKLIPKFACKDNEQSVIRHTNQLLIHIPILRLMHAVRE